MSFSKAIRKTVAPNNQASSHEVKSASLMGTWKADVTALEKTMIISSQATLLQQQQQQQQQQQFLLKKRLQSQGSSQQPQASRATPLQPIVDSQTAHPRLRPASAADAGNKPTAPDRGQLQQLNRSVTSRAHDNAPSAVPVQSRGVRLPPLQSTIAPSATETMPILPQPIATLPRQSEAQSSVSAPGASLLSRSERLAMRVRELKLARGLITQEEADLESTAVVQQRAAALGMTVPIPATVPVQALGEVQAALAVLGRHGLLPALQPVKSEPEAISSRGVAARARPKADYAKPWRADPAQSQQPRRTGSAGADRSAAESIRIKQSARDNQDLAATLPSLRRDGTVGKISNDTSSISTVMTFLSRRSSTAKSLGDVDISITSSDVPNVAIPSAGVSTLATSIPQVPVLTMFQGVTSQNCVTSSQPQAAAPSLERGRSRPISKPVAQPPTPPPQPQKSQVQTKAPEIVSSERPEYQGSGDIVITHNLPRHATDPSRVANKLAECVPKVPLLPFADPTSSAISRQTVKQSAAQTEYPSEYRDVDAESSVSPSNSAPPSTKAVALAALAASALPKSSAKTLQAAVKKLKDSPVEIIPVSTPSEASASNTHGDVILAANMLPRHATNPSKDSGALAKAVPSPPCLPVVSSGPRSDTSAGKPAPATSPVKVPTMVPNEVLSIPAVAEIPAPSIDRAQTQKTSVPPQQQQQQEETGDVILTAGKLPKHAVDPKKVPDSLTKVPCAPTLPIYQTIPATSDFIGTVSVKATQTASPSTVTSEPKKSDGPGINADASGRAEPLQPMKSSILADNSSGDVVLSRTTHTTNSTTPSTGINSLATAVPKVIILPLSESPMSPASQVVQAKPTPTSSKSQLVSPRTQEQPKTKAPPNRSQPQVPESVSTGSTISTCMAPIDSTSGDVLLSKNAPAHAAAPSATTPLSTAVPRVPVLASSDMGKEGKGAHVSSTSTTEKTSRPSTISGSPSEQTPQMTRMSSISVNDSEPSGDVVLSKTALPAHAADPSSKLNSLATAVPRCPVLPSAPESSVASMPAGRSTRSSATRSVHFSGETIHTLPEEQISEASSVSPTSSVQEFDSIDGFSSSLEELPSARKHARETISSANDQLAELMARNRRVDTQSH